MKKIPTLFERVFEGKRIVGITDKVYPGMEWVLEGEGEATIKIDGTCCAVIGGELYKRYDAKAGRKPPEGAIACCDPDPVTGHWPHWVKVDSINPQDKWYCAAYSSMGRLQDGTYELIGPHIQGNPYQLGKERLVRHGEAKVKVERTFEGIKQYLKEHRIEGLVFWLNGEPKCKIKRKDFGFEWPVKSE